MYRQHPAYHPRASRQRRGFTLVELLVVITIIAMLVGLLVPAVLAARGAARKSQCMNNQKQLATAVVNYVTTKQKFPPAFSIQPGPAGVNPSMGWVPPILPNIEQNELYRLIQGNTLINQMTPIQVEVLQCPARDLTTSPAPLNYVVNGGAQDEVTAGQPMEFQANAVFVDEFTPRDPAVMPANRPKPTPPIDMAYLSDHDGNSRTIMLAENNDARDWYLMPLIPSQATPVEMRPEQPGDGTNLFNFNSPNRGQSWWNSIVWIQPPMGAAADWGTASDGTTNNILKNPATFAVGAKTDAANGRPSSNHSGGFHLTYCDGRVQFTSQDIEYRVYCLLMAPDNAGAKYANSNAAGGAMSGSPVVYPLNWHQGQSATAPLIPVTDAEINP